MKDQISFDYVPTFSRCEPWGRRSSTLLCRLPQDIGSPRNGMSIAKVCLQDEPPTFRPELFLMGSMTSPKPWFSRTSFRSPETGTGQRDRRRRPATPRPSCCTTNELFGVQTMNDLTFGAWTLHSGHKKTEHTHQIDRHIWNQNQLFWYLQSVEMSQSKENS